MSYYSSGWALVLMGAIEGMVFPWVYGKYLEVNDCATLPHVYHNHLVLIYLEGVHQYLGLSLRSQCDVFFSIFVTNDPWQDKKRGRVIPLSRQWLAAYSTTCAYINQC